MRVQTEKEDMLKVSVPASPSSAWTRPSRLQRDLERRRLAYLSARKACGDLDRVVAAASSPHTTCCRCCCTTTSSLLPSLVCTRCPINALTAHGVSRALDVHVLQAEVCVRPRWHRRSEGTHWRIPDLKDANSRSLAHYRTRILAAGSEFESPRDPQ